ncbi:hypothetical protein [Flaviflexus equikiangi]|uniref:Uncharacterized protein n=1 Tax=Flaviflexus equikiangi TaxID=2758573 RepID=A0ABS2TCF8_9ACTO|nr:hypothetical protein [Flaviflexus equikiangi]MBM9432321.1 hypothetical protein [Flaviflexus equikiangi]
MTEWHLKYGDIEGQIKEESAQELLALELGEGVPGKWVCVELTDGQRMNILVSPGVPIALMGRRRGGGKIW